MEQKKLEFRLNTWEGYQIYLKKHIRPFFQQLNLSLSKVHAQHIQGYFNLKAKEGQSLSTLKKHYAVIRGALQEAVKKRILPLNPADGVTLPKQQGQNKFKGAAYMAEQAQTLLYAIRDDVLYPAVFLGLCYGLRRSEVLGLRWKDIDFKAEELHVKNTVTRMKTHIEHEATKSAASRRTLKLIPSTIKYLQQLHKEQLERRLLLGDSYTVTDHICVWADGKPLSPDYVSQHFKKFLQKHNLPLIRFHDLRHTAGSLLISQGMNIKQVQEFLGHEKSSTTLDIYAHIDMQAKKETADAMGEVLKLEVV
ncbi:MAG: site-specific integrase [Clostridiales bacterium]|nr:site-specific integrase [Clostridiales bacterium]